MDTIIQKSLEKSVTYSDYRDIVSKLLSEGKSTGNEQSEDLLHYSQLNEARMHRLDKTISVPVEIAQELNELPKKYILLTIAEGWCGDAAQIVPVLNKMAETSTKIDLQLVFRDENEELMNLFLTNGSKSIPKVIILDAITKEVIGSW